MDVIHPLDLPTFDRQWNYEIINIQYIREKNKKIVWKLAALRKVDI